MQCANIILLALVLAYISIVLIPNPRKTKMTFLSANQACAIRVKGQWHAVTVQHTTTCNKTGGQVVLLKNDSRCGAGVATKGQELLFRKNKEGYWDHVSRKDGKDSFLATGDANSSPLSPTQVGLLCTYGALTL